MKQCSVCEKFSTRFRNRQTQCRDCENKKNLERYHSKYRSTENHIKNTYRYTLKSQYDLTEDDFNALYADQKGLCPICLEQINNVFLGISAKRCAVDHCHKTGRVRKILCHKCNSSIGLIGDNLDNIKRMVEYLEYYS